MKPETLENRSPEKIRFHRSLRDRLPIGRRNRRLYRRLIDCRYSTTSTNGTTGASEHATFQGDSQGLEQTPAAYGGHDVPLI